MTVKELQNNMPVCGIDTLELISDCESKADLSKLPFVHSASRFRLADGKVKYVINPDKANGCRTITAYSEYQEVFDKMVDKMELTNPTISRIDFRFDNYNRDYDDYLKLNTSILLMLSQKYKVKNRYSSADLLTGQHLTARIQNKYFESEYYNKRIESPTEGIENRVECRSKCLPDGADEMHELDLWFDRICKAVSKEQYQELQSTVNYYLSMQYQAEQLKNPHLKPAEFLYRHNERIFTKAQLKAFYDKIGGYANPDEAARRFINRRNIETVSYSLIENYIKQLRQSADTFLNS